MKRMFFLSALSSLILVTGVASADPRPPHPPRPCPECEPKTREACFNLVCFYNNDSNPAGYKSCKVSARFNKLVTEGGGEVQDDSSQENSPQFEVTCDGSVIFNNSARRFTDMLGTRIQGETGPHPAISLPRGALHSGPDGSSGDHVAASTLDLDIGSSLLRTSGTCYLWTGIP